MTSSEYLSKLDKVEKLACSTKWNRLFSNPAKYISAIFFKEFIYPRSKKEKLRPAELFFGKKMLVALPASTDIYLTGGKSHDSEIRLARFLINNLHQGQSFLDIGAHYGYFTLLAASLVGKTGKVLSFEPSRITYNILEKNCREFELKNIQCFHEAVSDAKGKISFYEFPNLYSEYNSSSIEQFDNEAWLAQYKPEKVTVNARTIDQVLKEEHFRPDIIKIDVEGAEDKVIAGATDCLQHETQVVMEYLPPRRDNKAHQTAASMLLVAGYQAYIINREGKCEAVADIDAHLEANNTESDNIVFKKRH